MSMNEVPSIVTTELLLPYSSGPPVPYQRPPPPAGISGMPWVLFMFFHNQVYSGHFFHYFWCPWRRAVPNQWSRFLCWAHLHRLWWYLAWFCCFTIAPERLEVLLESKLHCDTWQSCLRVRVELKWALSYLLHSFGRSILHFSTSRLIFIYNPFPSHLRVARRPLESSLGWSNTVPHWELHIPLRTEALLWGEDHGSWFLLTLGWVFS